MLQNMKDAVIRDQDPAAGVAVTSHNDIEAFCRSCNVRFFLVAFEAMAVLTMACTGRQIGSMASGYQGIPQAA